MTAPAPATIDTLLEMARLAAMADFDRARPLWEATLIDGLADGGAALLCKLNHALTDGIGAVEIAMTLYDRTERYEKRHDAEGARVGGGKAPGRTPGRGLLRSRGCRTCAHGFVEGGAGVHRQRRSPTVQTVSAWLDRGVDTRTARPIGARDHQSCRDRRKIRRLAVHQVPKQALHQAGNVAQAAR